jgi:hypothetical protein
MSKKAKPTVSTSEPWKAAQPYLLGDDKKGITGVFPEAQGMYQQGGMNPAMQNAVDMYSGDIMGRATDPTLQSLRDTAGNMLGGANYLGGGGMDTKYGPVKNTSAVSVGLPQARAGQGVLDPTNAMQKMLSGRPDNPYLQQQIDAMSQNMARNVNENVMPGLRSESLASGQYGGSRQGIAEGLAMSRMNQDLAPAITNLLGGSYENAQNRMFGTATNLNDQAFQNANLNADRNMNTQQFNANLGLQNNAQQIGQNTQNLQNRLQGVGLANNTLNMLGGINSMQDNNFAQYMNAQQTPQNLNWQNLNNYAGIVQPGAGMGNTASQTNYSNPVSGALGGAMSGAMMGSIVPGLGTGVGALIGGGMGLLGGM